MNIRPDDTQIKNQIMTTHPISNFYHNKKTKQKKKNLTSPISFAYSFRLSMQLKHFLIQEIKCVINHSSQLIYLREYNFKKDGGLKRLKIIKQPMKLKEIKTRVNSSFLNTIEEIKTNSKN